MNISFIGAGKVGTCLGIYFKNNHIKVLGYYSRSFKSAQEASFLTGSTAFESITQALEADIIIISTNDDAISQVVSAILQLANTYKNKLFVHTSGALAASSLKALKNDTSYCISLHPIQAFTDIDRAVTQLKETVFSIEGDLESIPLIENLLDQCGNRYFVLSEDQKPLYHASACVLSNYLVTLLDYGFSILEHMGLPEELAMAAFFPLIEASLYNVKVLGPADALTGPIARGDLKTIQKHLEAFDLTNLNKSALYKLMGLSTIELAQRNKLKDPDLILTLSKLLEA